LRWLNASANANADTNASSREPSTSGQHVSNSDIRK